MNYDQILALLASLILNDPAAGPFDQLAAGGYDPAVPVTIASCPRPLPRAEIEGKTIICGTVSVPENHDKPDGTRVDLIFTLMKSHSSYPAPDPLLHLHGGPGGGVLGRIEKFAEIFDPWRATRDIVMFDQRAAGLSSSSVSCFDALASNLVDIAQGKLKELVAGGDRSQASQAMKDCLAELAGKNIDLAQYNTLQNALDVPAVMATLGYDTYNIYGISYGTKLTLEVMRSAPQGLRAVIIDGVAPLQVAVYDTLPTPLDEAMTDLVKRCAADEACNAAYPELGKVLHEALDRAAAGEIKIDGQPMPVQIVFTPISKRNGSYGKPSLTPYLPAYIYELAKGGDMPTVKMLVDHVFDLPNPGPGDVRAQAKALSEEQKQIIDVALADAEVLNHANQGLDILVDQLKAALRRARELGPLPALFDQEMTKASTELFKDRARLQALVVDYAALQTAAPSKEALNGLIEKYYQGAGRARLLALIEAMSETEVEATFAFIRSDVNKHQLGFITALDNRIYACQEDFPYNSRAGYQTVVAGLNYPQARVSSDPTAELFYTQCEQFTPTPRPGFHDPVVSDIPTLSLGGEWDTQTAASWAAMAVETLTNAQVFIIPEAGHGALAYQDCVVDMGVAFINDPSRKFDDSCVESSKPKFYIAPWVKKAE